MVRKIIHNSSMKFCYGISSQIANFNQHVMFFDYDGADAKDFIDWLLQVQDDQHLSDIYVIKSTHGYNAVCLDVTQLEEIKRIGLDITSPCDRKFFELNAGRGYYTLRFDGVDKELACILSAEGRLPKSRAHKNFLEWFFNITIIDDIWLDEGQWPTIIKYASAKNGYHIERREWAEMRWK